MLTDRYWQHQGTQASPWGCKKVPVQEYVFSKAWGPLVLTYIQDNQFLVWSIHTWRGKHWIHLFRVWKGLYCLRVSDCPKFSKETNVVKVNFKIVKAPWDLFHNLLCKIRILVDFQCGHVRNSLLMHMVSTQCPINALDLSKVLLDQICTSRMVV